MQATVLTVRADDEPRDRSVNAGPHLRYRNPRVNLESRGLGVLRADHVRVEMLYAGLCGTDLHLVEADPVSGYVRTSAPASIPPDGRVIGHEGVGRVVEVGSHVDHLRAGDHVAFASILACLRCDTCRRGAFNQCRGATLLGMEFDGLFATVADVPASLAHDVSAMGSLDADLQAAACLEPAGVAMQACEKAQVHPGDRVVVFGAGPIGLYCAILCKRVFGASSVTVVEPIERRRQVASAWCDAVHDVPAYLDGEGGPIDVLIEGTGVLDNIDRVFRRLEPGVRVVMLGRSGRPLSVEATDHLITQAISISGVRGHLGGSLGKVITLYRAGMFPLHAAITEVLGSLGQMHELLQKPDRIAAAQCKVLVRVQPQCRPAA